MDIPFSIPSNFSSKLRVTLPLVVDGDGLVGNIGIRIYGIDAPEQAQPHGTRALRGLDKLLMRLSDQQEVHDYMQLEVKGVDAFGRLLAVVFIGDTDVGRELVCRGHAWGAGAYCAEEQEARENRRGLWKAENPESPVQYKQRMRQASGHSRNSSRQD